MGLLISCAAIALVIVVSRKIRNKRQREITVKQRIPIPCLFSALSFIFLFSVPVAAKSDRNFIVSPQGVYFVKKMIRQEIDIYLDGGETLFTYDFPAPEIRSNALDISNLYANVPEIADIQYKGKVILVAAAVRRLGTDDDGNSFAYLISGEDTYNDAIAIFSRDYFFLNRTVLLICRGGGHDGAHALLVDCQTYNDAIGFDPRSELLPQSIDEQINMWFSKGVPPAFLKGDKEKLTALFFSYWIGATTDITSKCQIGSRSDNCVEEMKNMWSSHLFKIQDFIDDYQSAKDFLHLPNIPSQLH